MARNRRSTPDIVIVCDGVMYYYRTSLSQVTDADLLAPLSLTVVDGIIIIGTAQNKWQAEATLMTPVHGTRCHSSAPTPRLIRGCCCSHGRTNADFRTETCEFWVNAGGADATRFSRTAVMDLGCLAAQSVAGLDQTVAWVAHDGKVYRLQGYAGKRISTPSVERDIEDI